MTNRQWLLEQMQNMSDEELYNLFLVKSELIGCEYMDCGEIKCVDCQAQWLKAEYKVKPKLSDAERVILENVKGFKWICRDKSGYLYLYSAKPFKNGTIYRGWNTDQRIDENF